MDLSHFIALAFGLTLSLVGVGYFTDYKFYRKIYKDFLRSPFQMLVSGVLSLVLGIAIVIYHNIWDFSWPVIVTIFGWISLLKGFLRLLFPKFVMNTIKMMVKCKKTMKIFAISSIVFGVILTLLGFFG